MSVMNKARKEDQRIEIEGNRIKINAEAEILKRRCIEMMNPKQIPAITIVELCKRLDIGVGAGIAQINQEEKGNWADFVDNAIKKDKRNEFTLKGK